MRVPAICEKSGLKKGTWTPEEDAMLSSYIKRHGSSNWGKLPQYAGLNRCGKSCRLRWLNYLRPDLKRGNFTAKEEELIADLHEKLGTSWSKIAASLPGRSDNEIKNYWHTHLKDRSKKHTKSKAAKQKPKSVVLESFSEEYTASIILESSHFGLQSQQKSQGFSLTVGDEVIVAGERNPETEEDIWCWMLDPESMLEIIESLPKLDDDDGDVVIISNEVIRKLSFEFESGEDITSVLDFPVSPKSPKDISPLTVEGDVVIVEKTTTNEFAALVEPNVEFDPNCWDNYSFLSKELDLAYVLAEAPILRGAWHEYPYNISD